MKIQKLALVGLVCGLVLAFSVSAYAAAATYTCTVNSAGPQAAGTANYKMAIKLTSTPGTKTFVAPTGKEKEFLAVALTAIANGKKVSVVIDWAATNVLATMYLLP